MEPGDRDRAAETHAAGAAPRRARLGESRERRWMEKTDHIYLRWYRIIDRSMSIIQELLKPGGGIALIPFIRATIMLLMVIVM